jgi:hypothetical protein
MIWAKIWGDTFHKLIWSHCRQKISEAGPACAGSGADIPSRVAEARAEEDDAREEGLVRQAGHQGRQHSDVMWKISLFYVTRVVLQTFLFH